MENNQLQPRKKQKVKKILTQGNKSLFTEYLKINSYNPITFLVAFLSAFIHAFMRSNISSRWANGSMQADFGLFVVALFFWLSFALNVQRVVYGTRVDQLVFVICASLGTVVGVAVFG
jgi:hypothetical protein